jgi:predicted DCC family thiol-disulfide oxidoreductase YuxK
MDVLYDSDCGLCRVSIAVLLRWDRRRSLEPVALQSERADRLLAGIDYAERNASFHVVLAGGRILSGGAAAPALLAALPGGRAFAAITRHAPNTTDRLYRAVADNRARIGPLIPPRMRAWASRELDRRSCVGG